jgi:hypothetical protein
MPLWRLPISMRAQEIIETLGDLLDHSSTTLFERQCRAVHRIAMMGMTLRDIDLLPVYLELPIREALEACRQTPPIGWPLECFSLVERNDLAMQLGADMENCDRIATSTSARTESETKKDRQAGASKLLQSPIFRLRFGTDRRLEEGIRLLSSTEPIKISLSGV